MDDTSFKEALIKVLEKRANTDCKFGTDKMREVIKTLPNCNVYIEKTDLFTRHERNTYCSILHIQVPIDKRDSFIAEREEILEIAESIYGRQGDNYLTYVDIGISVEHYKVIDFRGK